MFQTPTLGLDLQFLFLRLILIMNHNCKERHRKKGPRKFSKIYFTRISFHLLFKSEIASLSKYDFKKNRYHEFS